MIFFFIFFLIGAHVEEPVQSIQLRRLLCHQKGISDEHMLMTRMEMSGTKTADGLHNNSLITD